MNLHLPPEAAHVRPFPRDGDVRRQRVARAAQAERHQEPGGRLPGRRGVVLEQAPEAAPRVGTPLKQAVRDRFACGGWVVQDWELLHSRHASVKDTGYLCGALVVFLGGISSARRTGPRLRDGWWAMSVISRRPT